MDGHLPSYGPQHRPPLHAVTSLPAPPDVSTIQLSNAQPKPPVFVKMEGIVREMQHPDTGIPIRSQKLFLTSIPSAFMGCDLVEWLVEMMDIEETAEAVHLANLLCQFGYFFPVGGETRPPLVKDDSSLYRFQTPYYWPSQNHSADTTDYAIYLTKRISRNKQKHCLEEYELETYAKLKKGLQHKWDFVQMQAEEQVRLSKERKKGDKIVSDSQERAYWRVYRPPQGFTNCLERAPVPDKTNMANRVRKKTTESVNQELSQLRERSDRTCPKVSVTSETLVSHSEVFLEYDSLLVTPNPSNPWISDEEEFWLLNNDCAENPSDRRVKRWAISFQELISDPRGVIEFNNYLRKEYSHENIRFWQAVNKLRYGPASSMKETVDSIYEEFLKPGAPCEINIDGKTMEETQLQRRQPTRYTYDLASEHVYVMLLKKDCYPRFLRSEDYKNLCATALQPSAKKNRFLQMMGKNKKTSTSAGASTSSSAALSNSMALVQVTPQPLKRHGSDEQQRFDVTDGGVHLGGSTPTPPLSSHKLECEQPYSASSDTQDMTQSSICPWDDAESLNICPWETTEPPAKTQAPPAQVTAPSQLQQQQSFRLETSSGNLKGKPPDRSISVDVCSMALISRGIVSSSSALPVTTAAPAVAQHLSPNSGHASDAKVTLNVCPWETQELPQKQQERTKNIDLVDSERSSDINKQGGSISSIPSILGNQEIGQVIQSSPPSNLKSYMDRRPSMHAERKVSPSACTREQDRSAIATPAVSLQDLHTTQSQQHFILSDLTSKSHVQRLNTDLSHIKINVDSSGDTDKSTHRELSASVSVPCTSILCHHSSALDYTVRSGHDVCQFDSPVIPLSNQHQSITHSNSSHCTLAGTTAITTQYSSSMSSPEGGEDSSVPVSTLSTTNVRRAEAPRTVSVSSQTQTDPIVHRKSHQQTQHPSRDSGRYSSKHSSSRQSKQTYTQYSVDPSTQTNPQSSSAMKQPSMKPQHMQLQLYQKPVQQQDSRTGVMPPPQASPHSGVDQHHLKYNQQQRQQQYLLSREEGEQQQRNQQEHQRKAIHHHHHQQQQQKQQHVLQYQEQKQLQIIEQERHQEQHRYKQRDREQLEMQQQQHLEMQQQQHLEMKQQQNLEIQQKQQLQMQQQQQQQDRLLMEMQLKKRQKDQQIMRQHEQERQLMRRVQEEQQKMRHLLVQQDQQQQGSGGGGKVDTKSFECMPRNQESVSTHDRSTKSPSDGSSLQFGTSEMHQNLSEDSIESLKSQSDSVTYQESTRHHQQQIVSEYQKDNYMLVHDTCKHQHQQEHQQQQRHTSQVRLVSSHHQPSVATTQQQQQQQEQQSHQMCSLAQDTFKPTASSVSVEGSSFGVVVVIGSSEQIEAQAKYNKSGSTVITKHKRHLSCDQLQQKSASPSGVSSQGPSSLPPARSDVVVSSLITTTEAAAAAVRVTTSPKKIVEAAKTKVWDDPSDICPWEDEESCRIDAPFVKTYATLGYL